jgi:hypothetical protein
MVETWEHLRGVPMFYHVTRIPMDALSVETSIAEGERALQALIPFARPVEAVVSRFALRP